MEAASLTMREARGEFTASLHCADAEGEDVFTVPLRMSVSNVQRHEATFVFDVTDKASSFIDGRINGTVRDANALDGFMSIRLSLPDMDDVVVAGRWSGARLA